jgi:hypothetical protein
MANALETRTKTDWQPQRLERAVDRAAEPSLGKAAFAIRQTAIEEIKPEAGPSEPGTPPHTHPGSGRRKGILPRAIVYDVDKQKQEAVIGPRESVAGDVGRAFEFAGEFRGERYPPRPFMGPALDANLEKIPAGFAGSVIDNG